MPGLVCSYMPVILSAFLESAALERSVSPDAKVSFPRALSLRDYAPLRNAAAGATLRAFRLAEHAIFTCAWFGWSSFRGAALAASPESITTGLGLWIPGPRA